MHKNLITWQLIHKSLLQGIPVMLMYVLESKGSSPGRQGFMMAVNAEGTMCGSLGGGIMEHKFVELAKAKLRDNNEEHAVHKQIHNKSASQHQSGMICSGEQTIFIYRIKKEEREAIEQLIATLQQYHNGTLTLTVNSLSFSEKIPEQHYLFEPKGANDFLFVEKTGYKNTLYVIGGGHCALAFCSIMRSMDFYIHLIDDREGLNTMEQNCFAHEKKVVDDYADLHLHITPGLHTYVVVMTFGYRTDALAVKSLQGLHFKYVGVLGSKNKILQLFDQFKQEGGDESWLQKVHAPVGIPIKSQTTEEIAISIAAEIIRVKNESL